MFWKSQENPGTPASQKGRLIKSSYDTSTFNPQLQDGTRIPSSYPSKLDILVHPNTPRQHKPENY